MLHYVLYVMDKRQIMSFFWTQMPSESGYCAAAGRSGKVETVMEKNI